MLSSSTRIGSTDRGTSFSDIIMNNVNAVSNGQVSGFQSFLHEPKALRETCEQMSATKMPGRFIEAVTARRILTNQVNSTWKCPLNLQTPLTCPIPWTIFEADKRPKSGNNSDEFQIMRTIDFVGRNYIRIQLPEIDTTDITTKVVNGVQPPKMTDPSQMYLGAWHRDLVPRIISEVDFYPRSNQHSLFKYTGYDIAVHNIIFGNANREMNDLMSGEDKFELTYDPYRVDGTALGIASFKGIDTYKEYAASAPVSGQGVTYTSLTSVIQGEQDGFVDIFQKDTSMDDSEFKNFYRRNVWYEAPVAVPYDCRHSIHSRRFFHRSSIIIIPLDVLPFGYSIESSLPAAALASDCGFIQVKAYDDWFDRSFYLTKLSDVPSLHPIIEHKHYALADYASGQTYDPASGRIVNSIDTLDTSDPRIGWVNTRSIGKFGDPEWVQSGGIMPTDPDADLLDNHIRQQETVVGRNVAGLEGVVPTRNQPKQVGGAMSTNYLPKSQAYGGTINKPQWSKRNTSTSSATSARSRLDFDTRVDPTLENVFLQKPSNVDSAWSSTSNSGLNIRLLQIGYTTLYSIKQMLSRLPNIYLTTEWEDYDTNLNSQEIEIRNDLYIMGLLYWFLPVDSNGVESMRLYPHHKIDTEYPIIAGIEMDNEQSQGKITYTWDMMNLLTPAQLGLKPLLSNMGMISFTPVMIPNQLPYAIYDQNLSGYLKTKFKNGESGDNIDTFINMRAGRLKIISIGINGIALVNQSLFRLVF